MTPVPGSAVRTRFNLARGVVGPVGDNDHAGVNRVANPDPSTVVHGDPRRAASGVEQGVQDWPVGDRVRAVAHAFGLAVGRSDRAGVQVVPPDDDRGAHFALADQVVEQEAGTVALAIAEPADTCRKPLESDALAGERQPAPQRGVAGEEAEQGFIGRPDVFRVARESGPPKRALALAKQGTDEEGHEAADLEGVLHASLLRLAPQVVAVVEDDRSAALPLEKRPHVAGHGLVRALDVPLRVLPAQGREVLVGCPRRDVALELVVGRGLVRDEIGRGAAGEQPLVQVDRVRLHSDRDGPPRLAGVESHVDRPVERVFPHVQVPRGKTPVDAPGVDLGDQGSGSVHRGRQRLGAAHASQARRHDEPSREVASEVSGSRGGKGLVSALQDSLAPDVDPGSGRHLAVHRETEPLEAPELLSGRPRRHQQRIRDQDAGSVLVRPEDTDGLSGLDEERLVATQPHQSRNDRLEALPVPGGAARAAVHDQLVGLLGDVGVEVVLEHSQRRLLGPTEAADLRAPGSANRARPGFGVWSLEFGVHRFPTLNSKP